MKRLFVTGLLFVFMAVAPVVSSFAAEPVGATNSGPISSVTVAGLVAQNGTPTPTTPIDIVSNNGVLKVSTNLYNSATTTAGVILADSGAESPNADGAVSDYIKVKPNTRYTLSFVRTATGIYTRVATYSSNKTFSELLVKDTLTTAGERTYSFTTDSNAEYIRFCFKSDSTNIQLELGNTAKPYMPYGQIYTEGEIETIGDSANHTATVATLLGIGDNRDTQNINTGAITRNVGVKVLDGTEEYVYSAPNTYGIVNITSTIIGKVDGNANLFMCSHFVPQTRAWSSTQTEGVLNGNNNNQVFFRVLGTRIPSLSAWTQFLAEQYAAGTPVIVVYPLATPTTESVTGQTMTTAPVNNRTGGVTGMTITTLLSSGTSVVTTIATNAIKIATTAYNAARFNPVKTDLNDAVATIREIVTKTINQTAAIASLQADKQTRPEDACPVGKKCLLVETEENGVIVPHWFPIIEAPEDN